MKILIVNKYLSEKGGSETYVFTLANELKKQGHQVCYFGMESKNIQIEDNKYFIENRDYANLNTIKKIKYILSINYYKKAKKLMSEVLIKEKPDLVIFNLVHRQITLAIIEPIKKANIPIFWVTHDLIFCCPSYTMLDNTNTVCEKCLKGDYKECFKNKCIKGSNVMSYLGYREAKYIQRKKYYQQIDLFITPSKFYYDKFLEGNFTNSKIVHLANPYAGNYELNIGKDYILYFGRLSREKGIFTLINAATLAQKNLIILGTGPLETEIIEYIKSNKYVTYLGYKRGKELESYIKEAKVVVLPSQWYENGPYSALEALAKGKPLIVANIGGLPELVINQENGYLFEPKNINDLKEKIENIYSLDATNYLKMCEKSLEIAKDKFNVSKYVEKLLEYYREC
jgi:glycosyltransferase involved in cell wall biosynthesis